jgi:hypothetical protein
MSNSMELSPWEDMSASYDALHYAVFMCWCVLRGNAADNLWLLDVIPQFVGYLPGRIKINYNTPNIIHKSGLLITRQSFTGWPLCFPLSYSQFACMCRYYFSLITELKLSVHSLLIWNWLHSKSQSQCDWWPASHSGLRTRHLLLFDSHGLVYVGRSL